VPERDSAILQSNCVLAEISRVDPYAPYDQPTTFGRFERAGPAVVWGAVMAAALLGAGAVIWRSHGAGETARLVAAAEGREIAALGQDVRRLALEREELADRLARLERGVGELKLAAQSLASTETTGSIARPAAAAKGGAFAVSLGPDANIDAVRRRWTALAARHPGVLAKLSPRALRSEVGAGVFELVAGPFASAADAGRACASLAEEGLACDTTSYAGEPIARP
jgi:hypothetical protein